MAPPQNQMLQRRRTREVTAASHALNYVSARRAVVRPARLLRYYLFVSDASKFCYFNDTTTASSSPKAPPKPPTCWQRTHKNTPAFSSLHIFLYKYTNVHLFYVKTQGFLPADPMRLVTFEASSLLVERVLFGALGAPPTSVAQSHIGRVVARAVLRLHSADEIM